ncbi:MAG TPA: membrane protein insertase YidC [bacterium (Candidatus Stahlbacteria)]|nr:membrane protein insertase YidC [Candidatus Stahlbacteria bacterium]
MDDTKRIMIAFVLVFLILLLYNQLFYKPPPKKAETVKEVVEVKEEPVIEEKKKPEFPESTITVEKRNYRAVITNYGAGLKSLYLKEYKAELMGDVNFISSYGDSDVISSFSLKRNGDTVFGIRGTFKKIYIFDEYGFRVLSEPPGKERISIENGLAVTEFKNRGDDLKRFACYVRTDQVRKVKVKEPKRYLYNPAWIGLRNKYFFMVLEPVRPIESFTLFRTEDKRYGLEITTIRTELKVSFLPIDYWFLADFKKDYEKITTGGLFGPIGRLILRFFRFLFPIIGNFGFVIMIFALLVKLILHPLNRQQLAMQHKMQLLQPELERLKKKYKDDPQGLNREMMNLYKAHGFNPAGCFLPLIIQLPLFMALYNMLLTSIDFRQAPFVFWIKDLSVKDPYYVLPIVMGAMFLIQSLITTTDPRNRMMSIFMPIFFTFIFLNFPSGLQLYWLSFNLFSIIESLWYRRLAGGIR